MPTGVAYKLRLQSTEIHQPPLGSGHTAAVEGISSSIHMGTPHAARRQPAGGIDPANREQCGKVVTGVFTLWPYMA